MNEGVTAWLLVISAVITMKKNGARNIAANAIRKACCPTELRKRCRFTCGGIGRESIPGIAPRSNAVSDLFEPGSLTTDGRHRNPPPW